MKNLIIIVYIIFLFSCNKTDEIIPFYKSCNYNLYFDENHETIKINHCDDAITYWGNWPDAAANGIDFSWIRDYSGYQQIIDGKTYTVLSEEAIKKLIESGEIRIETWWYIDAGNNILSTNNKKFTKKDLPRIVTSLMVDMSSLFKNEYVDFDITSWDVSNVRNMSSMFYESDFNQPIGNWDVSNVTRMDSMFFDANRFTAKDTASFNQPIGNWDVSNVTNMSAMFYGTNFNQDISDWNVGKVTDMSAMFYSNFRFITTKEGLFNQPLGNWDVSNVTTMSFMFHGTKFNQEINNWNTDKLIDISGMFSYQSTFNKPLDNWKTLQLKKISYLFQNNTTFNQDISSWKFKINIHGDPDLNCFYYDRLATSWEEKNKIFGRVDGECVNQTNNIRCPDCDG